MDDLCFDLKQLQTFVMVVETRSFTATAQNLAQTQSAVSQQMAALEKGLNTQLLDRSKRPVQVTVAGQEFYLLAAKLLEESKLIQERIYATKEGLLSSLKLGIIDSISQTIGIEVLKLLRPRAKKIIQIAGTAPELLNALIEGKINIALTMIHTAVPNSVQMYPLMLEEYFVVSPIDWPTMNLEELCRQRDYIAYASWTPTGAQTLNWLKWRKLQPKIQFEIVRADDILRLIANGYGWTLATPLFLTLFPSPQSSLRLSPLPEPGLSRKLALICKDGEFNDFCKAFSLEVNDILKKALQASGYNPENLS